jgi:N-acetylmuramoyl-L-alanine amidase
MPAVLVEVAFMVHPDEYAKLIDPAFQQKVAKALCDGLVKYMHAQ